MMRTNPRSWNEQRLDCDYIEEISDLAAAGAVGGAGVAVKTYASATGNLTYTAGYVATFAEQLAKGGAIAFGYGATIAIGNNPTSGVNVAGTGDIVFQNTSTATNARISASQGVVMAIDIS